MKLNVKKVQSISLLLVLVMMLSVVFASCVNTDNEDEIIGGNFSADTDIEESDTSEEELPTPEGATEAPKVVDVVNLAPTTVAIAGTCEAGAQIRVTGGSEEATAVANGEYFIIQVELLDQAKTLLEISATVEGKDESLKKEVIAQKDATAQGLLNGNNVSIGLNSRLYFDKMAEDASGNNLYTVSELEAIRAFVSDNVNAYYDQISQGQDVEFIYVLIPNSATIYPEVFPEGVVGETVTTLYDQILETLGNTRATVVDMREVFLAAVQNEELMKQYGGLYRITDSALSDYGAYLTYSEVMNVVAQTFPDAAPKSTEDFEWKTVSALGGNLVTNRGLSNDVIVEELVVSQPKFSLKLGSNKAGSTYLSSLRKYVDPENGDYNYFTDVAVEDGFDSVAERWLIEDTSRTELSLPSAMIYRDYSALPFTDILLERFEKALLNVSGSFPENVTSAGTYAAGDDAAVDYIIVFLSEENMDTAFKAALK